MTEEDACLSKAFIRKLYVAFGLRMFPIQLHPAVQLHSSSNRLVFSDILPTLCGNIIVFVFSVCVHELVCWGLVSVQQRTKKTWFTISKTAVFQKFTHTLAHKCTPTHWFPSLWTCNVGRQAWCEQMGETNRCKIKLN